MLGVLVGQKSGSVLSSGVAKLSENMSSSSAFISLLWLDVGRLSTKEGELNEIYF